MSACPFAAPGRQEACLSLQRQRTELMTREYDRNECYSCPMRRKRLEGSQEPERIAIPPARFINQKPETIILKKEASVDQGKMKENVLKVLGRKGKMTIANLKLFAAANESKEDFRGAVDALAREGKVATEEGARAGSLLVTLPGNPAGTAEKKVITAKPTPVRAVAATPKPPRSFGETPINAVIADLEARRAKIDSTLETLRSLA